MLNLHTVPDTLRYKPSIDISGLNYRISFLSGYFGYSVYQFRRNDRCCSNGIYSVEKNKRFCSNEFIALFGTNSNCENGIYFVVWKER